MRILISLILVFGGTACRADAQVVMPPRWDDLPRLATNWPPAWAALVREAAQRDDFEKYVLARVPAVMQTEKPSSETYPIAEMLLAATLRHHESVRQAAPPIENPTHSLRGELQDRLAKLRADWLKSASEAEALLLADRWLATASRDGLLRPAIRQLWLQQANAALAKNDLPAVRAWMDRLDNHFDGNPIDAIRKALEARPKATGPTLVIGVPALPDQFSPATAWTEVEKQTLDLLFDRLYEAEWQPVLGRRYRPQLAAALPDGSLHATVPLRRDVYWSNGERLTSGDLRHTALLSRTALWRDFLDKPRFEGNPFLLTVGYRQGLLDPLAPLTFHVLPQYYRGKQLDRADDPEFAKLPIGSGPFHYVGGQQDAGRNFAVFQTNPCDRRTPTDAVREIRLTAWTDPRKDLPKPLPHLILDAPTDQLTALKELGYTEVRVGAPPAVTFLAVNHRKPTLASISIRRALAHALDRQTLLNRHFRGKSAPDKYHATSNALFPRDSWGICPAPRVPAELFDLEQARSFARKAKNGSAALEWTLKYPAGAASVKAACEEVAHAIAKVLHEAGIKANINAVGLPPSDLRKAIVERDYDLAYHTAVELDDPVQLALFFDPGAAAGNLLGYDSDVKLLELLRAVLKHRQFHVAQTNMHALHAHLYETMPAIPLWQLDLHVLTQPSLRMPTLHSRNVFAQIRHWKLLP